MVQGLEDAQDNNEPEYRMDAKYIKLREKEVVSLPRRRGQCICDDRG